jgi:hypothetical protein
VVKSVVSKNGAKISGNVNFFMLNNRVKTGKIFPEKIGKNRVVVIIL